MAQPVRAGTETPPGHDVGLHDLNEWAAPLGPDRF